MHFQIVTDHSEDLKTKTSNLSFHPSVEAASLEELNSGAVPSNTLTFQNVVYTVSGFKKFKWKTKTILNNVRYVY